MGIDEVGIDKVGIDEVGRYRKGQGSVVDNKLLPINLF